MKAKENVLTIQLLAVCIFQSKGMGNKISGAAIDLTIDSLRTVH